MKAWLFKIDFVSYKFYVDTLPASSIIQLVSGLGWDSVGTLWSPPQLKSIEKFTNRQMDHLIFLPLYSIFVKCNETTRNETKWSETKRKETKRNETKRNETILNEIKLNEMKWNEMKLN